MVVGGPFAQTVALLWRLAVGSLHGHPSVQAGGQAKQRRAKCWSLFVGGALGHALSPPQDAQVSEPVEAWDHKAGLLSAVQAYGTSHSPVLWPHSPRAVVGWRELGMSNDSLSLALQ